MLIYRITISICCFMLCLFSSIAQNVGIGTTTPAAQLHIAGSASERLRLDNLTSLNPNINTEMFFKTGSWYTGAIKTTGLSNSTAKMSFYTNSATIQSGLLERMSIFDNGIVGIGNIATPSLAGLMVDYKIGAVNAIFGSNDIGVAIESNYPGVAFNSYYNGGRKAISAGFGGLIGLNPVTGDMYLQSSLSSIAGGVAMPLNTRLNISSSGKVGIGGSSSGSMLEIIPSFGASDIELNAQVPGGDNAILRLNKNGTGNYSAVRFKNQGTATWDLGTQGTDEFRLVHTPTNITAIQVDNATRRVGIGTNGYNAQLNVAGGIYDYNDLTVMGNTGIGTASPLATLDVIRGTAPNGTAEFEGTTYASHFNYSIAEDTYIRGGKAASNVYINDLSYGVVGIAASGGKVGVGTNTPSYPFTVQSSGQGITQVNGGVIAGLYLSSNTAYLQTVSAHSLSFATNNGSAQMTLLTNGNLGIGTVTPTARLQVTNASGNAIEISGGIKVSGSNKPAFTLTCDATNLTDDYTPPVNYYPGHNYHGVWIDNTLSNGDPNAIILVTPVDYTFPYAVSYDSNAGKWKIKINPAGVTETSCFGQANPQGVGCGAYYVSVMPYNPQTISAGNKFNVMIIKQ